MGTDGCGARKGRGDGSGLGTGLGIDDGIGSHCDGMGLTMSEGAGVDGGTVDGTGVDGLAEGTHEGRPEGGSDGVAVGTTVGFHVAVGTTVGYHVGNGNCMTVGSEVRAGDGRAVGCAVGGIGLGVATGCPSAKEKPHAGALAGSPQSSEATGQTCRWKGTTRPVPVQMRHG